jgi:hypothetical protein
MDVNRRLADILAQYTDTMSRIEHQPEARTEAPCDGRLLKPADKQRPCAPPTFGGDPSCQGLSSATTLSSISTGSASGSAASVLGRTASGSANSR